MKKISTLAVVACLTMIAACSTSAPEAPAANTSAPAPDAVLAPANAASIVGSWVDDENDTYTFAADGTATGSGQVSMTGSWKADGEDRYAVDLNSPAGLAKGTACVSGDTMGMRIGDGSLTLLGKVGADGKAAAVDSSMTCE
ncbi:MAG: hypothetical protein V4808_14090 [Pseudomonadota bacterium]